MKEFETTEAVSEIQGFNPAPETPKKKSKLDVINEASKLSKNTIRETAVVSEETTLSDGKFQVIGVNYTDEFKDFLSQNKLTRDVGLGAYELPIYMAKTKRAEDLMRKRPPELHQAPKYHLTEEILSKGYDTYIIKWLEHEDWKTDKLISSVKFKACNTIRSKFRKTFSRDLIKQYTTLLLDYLLCMESPEVFSDYYKLSRSGMLFNPIQKVNDRRANKYEVRFPLENRKEACGYLDSEGYGISTRTSDFLRNLLRDSRKLTRYLGSANNAAVYKYVNQACLRDDSQAAEEYIHVAKKLDKIPKDVFMSMGIYEVVYTRTLTYKEYLAGIDKKYIDFIKAKQEYLREGCLAMLCSYIYEQGIDDANVAEAIIDSEYGPRYNPNYQSINGTSISEVLIDAIIYNLSKSGFDTYTIASAIQYAITDAINTINLIQSDNIKMHTDRIISTERIYDSESGKTHYETKSHPHAKSPLFKFDNLPALKNILSAVLVEELGIPGEK